MQSPNTTIHQACDLLKDCVQSIKYLRTKYKEIVTSSKIICLKWGISTKSKIQRNVFAEKHFGDMDGDRRLDITEDNLQVSHFTSHWYCIDTTTREIW